ncbi:hypothetical protein BJ973_000436 [Actinoplanes tereljensis]|uniref:Uncharacterized protein n=1 Tax=Paractinoplanes tereljensis TaxID=571912 RepID=A0A919TU35_9ACTN|nr:hypothetical protein [Actinoplanes tereljensis]GIF23208.1 hypothetical protein Ate02nite_59380 [Actinoplanes tereljensis]
MTATNALVVRDDLGEIVDLVLRGAEANARHDLVRRMRAAADDVAAALPSGPIAEAVVCALQSLEVDLRSRRAELADPGRAARLAAEARHAEARLRQFQERTVRWPRVLGDALSATDSDIDFAINNWLRALLDEGTVAIEEQGLAGDDLDRWLRKRLVAETVAVHRALRLAAQEIGEQVAASIGLSEPVPPVRLDLEPPAELVGYIHRGPRALSERQALATRLVGVVMPTYSGVMVALFLPRLLGIGMSLWPTVLGAVAGAVGMGGAAVAGERQRQRSRRNMESASELRSLVDAYRMAVGKRVRDGVRAVEQQMYAGLNEVVTNESRRMSATTEAARRAAGESERLQEALADIELDLASVRELRQRAQRLSWAG